MNQQQLIEQGKLLPLMEEFYSLQGEGHHTGKPAWFIRIGGCDVGCRWCDVKESWNANLHPLTPTQQIAEHAAECIAKAVVVTGGEPLQFNLNYLCQKLHAQNIQTYLETSGSEPLSGKWHWICLSPKQNVPPLPAILPLANELKVIIHNSADFAWAEKYSTLVNPTCKLLLQPEWSQYNKMIQQIVDYIMQNPKWSISIQAHKFMRIP